MHTSLNLKLDTRRKKKDNTFPIIIRISHLQRTTSISTGYYVEKEYWNPKKKQVKRSYKGVKSVPFLNNLLHQEIVKAQEIVNRLDYEGNLNFLSVTELKEKIIKKHKYESFFQYGLLKVEELKLAQRFGSARSYNGLIQILKVFTKGRDLKFNEINLNFLQRFEQFHLSKRGNTINGLASYMRTLKAIYNKAIKDGLVDREFYPFYNYKIKTTPTKKRAIKLESIKKIVNLNFDTSHELYHYRNYFLLSYLTMGMSFIDMAFLKRKNIIDGRIKFQRKKTSKIYDIQITEKINEILRVYSKSKQKEDFLLPVIKRGSLELQYKDAQWALKRYNKGLKKLATLANIDEHLTSYVSRHSFATQALFRNIPLAAISAMLGHSKLSTTQIYLKSLPSEILDNYQKELNKI